jgi:hypothetical protein
MTKLAEYLQTKKIDPRRLLAASHAVDALRDEDRAIKLLKRRAKGGDEAAKGKLEGKRKPRSGRTLSRPALDAALAGKPVSGPSKSRILRAVNAVLAKRKDGGEATFRDLF